MREVRAVRKDTTSASQEQTIASTPGKLMFPNNHPTPEKLMFPNNHRPRICWKSLFFGRYNSGRNYTLHSRAGLQCTIGQQGNSTSALVGFFTPPEIMNCYF